MSLMMTRRGIVPPPNRPLVVIKGQRVLCGTVEIRRDMFTMRHMLRVFDGYGDMVFEVAEKDAEWSIGTRRSGRTVHYVSARGDT